MRTSTVYLLVTLSALFWGANFVLARPVMVDEPPLWAAALRFLIGTALMLGLTRWRRETLLGLARRHAGIYAMLGTVGIAGFNLLFFFALQHTSPTNASLIMATNPLLTTVLASTFLGERFSARQLAALPLALIGVVVVITGGHLQRLLSLHIASGDLMMLGADLAFACYTALGRRFMPAGSALSNTTLIMLVGTVVLVSVASGSNEVLTLPGLKAGSALLIMTIGGTVLAYLFWTTGIAHLGAGRTSLFTNLVPVFAMLAGVVAGSLPSTSQLTGGALVIGGVSLAILPRKQTVPCEA